MADGSSLPPLPPTEAERIMAARRLASLRAAIAEVDARLLALAADRARLAAAAAEAKRVLAQPTLDAAQEATVRARAHAHVATLARGGTTPLAAHEVDALLDALIAIGRRAQA